MVIGFALLLLLGFAVALSLSSFALGLALGLTSALGLVLGLTFVAFFLQVQVLWILWLGARHHIYFILLSMTNLEDLMFYMTEDKYRLQCIFTSLHAK